MKKKILAVLVILAVAAGGAFAQTDFDQDGFETMPKNTIVLDIGPTLFGVSWAYLGTVATASEGADTDDISYSGFGISAQYERQLLERLSVAGKIGYLGVGIGVSAGEEDTSINIDTNIASFTVEAHVRYYPFGGTFFLDGMLGYANMTLTSSGTISGKNENDETERFSASYTISRNYFNYGAKLGWRINFGRQGGFTFEPSLGWYGNVGLGDTFGKSLKKSLIKAAGEDIDFGDTFEDFDTMLEILENFIFIGGPRLTLAFGWRF
ncbi:MAG: autotransporter outer membrane beta-barrel domain-containing protein [Treponema sp.]|jgi:hypothetical protein|nr:autotransporter outer membrane beta-barrel domain-containing protein [Treponema sp.]